MATSVVFSLTETLALSPPPFDVITGGAFMAKS
jgi:hypothetical protein